MQQWLFVSSSGQQFTAHEPDVPALIQSGQITAQTLMWREGMAQWMPAASVFPMLFTVSAAVTQPMVAGPPAASTPAAAAGAAAGAAMTVSGAADSAVLRRLLTPLFERKGWIKFLAIVFIVGGILALPALLSGLLLIFPGLALWKLSGSLERAQATGDIAALEEVHQQAAKFFYLYGIYAAVKLALVVLFFGLFALGFGAAMLSGLKGMNAAPMGDPSNPFGIEEPATPGH